MKGGIVVCGNVVFDVLARPVGDPLPWGATRIVDTIAQQMGGNASTTSYTLGKLGAPVHLLTLLGNDSAAEFILNRLASVGVDLSRVERTSSPTSIALSLVNEQGERALLYQLGASADDFAEPVEFPQGAGHFHLAAAFRMQYLRRKAPELLRRARALGMTTSIDTQWDHLNEWLSVLAPSLPHTDILSVNEEEARMLTGTSDIRDAARILRSHGAGTVLVKLGSKGCLVAGGEGGGEFHVPAFAVSAIDTTGAGDCFVGGYLAALHRGLNLPEAVRFAAAVGALSVQTLGATTGLLTYGETEAWMAGRSGAN